MAVASTTGALGDPVPVLVLRNPRGWLYGFSLAAVMWVMIFSAGIVAVHKIHDLLQASHSIAVVDN